MYFGYIGLFLLLIGYGLFSNRKTEKYMIPINCIASLFLLIHAMLLKDIPFIITNLFITLVMAKRWILKEFVIK